MKCVGIQVILFPNSNRACNLCTCVLVCKTLATSLLYESVVLNEFAIQVVFTSLLFVRYSFIVKVHSLFIRNCAVFEVNDVCVKCTIFKHHYTDHPTNQLLLIPMSHDTRVSHDTRRL